MKIRISWILCLLITLSTVNVYSTKWYNNVYDCYDIIVENPEEKITAREFESIFKKYKIETGLSDGLYIKRTDVVNLIEKFLKNYNPTKTVDLGKMGIIIGSDEKYLTIGEANIISKRLEKYINTYYQDNTKKNVNILSNGFICETDENIFFSQILGEGIFKRNKMFFKKINDEINVKSLNYYNGYLCYLRASDIHLYNIRENKIYVVDDNIFGMIYMADGDVYYVKDGINKYNIISGKRTKILDEKETYSIKNFIVDGNYIYYEKGGSLYCCLIDSTGNTIIAKNGKLLLVSKESIYYSVNEKVYQMDKFNKNISMLPFENCRGLFPTDNGIYYVESMGVNHMAIKFYDLNSRKIELIDFSESGFNVCDDGMYYFIWGYNSKGEFSKILKFRGFKEAI